MSAELEQQLRAAFGRLPKPSREATARARSAALAAIGPSGGRPSSMLLLVFVAVAFGLGASLVALAPGNRRPWVHPTGGRVAAASWSPDGLKIAYVVARPGGYQLRIIEGDGSPDGLLVGHVDAVKPSWRPDALAVAYVD